MWIVTTDMTGFLASLLFPPLTLYIHGSSRALRSFRLVMVVMVCGVDFPLCSASESCLSAVVSYLYD